MTTCVGTIGLSTPQQIAAKAIFYADDTSDNPGTRFALHLDARNRVRISRVAGRKVSPEGWIATFTKRADPDWLAEEIQGAGND